MKDRYLLNKFFEGGGKQLYPFWVNGVNQAEKWEKLKSSIWSDLYSCAMFVHWDSYDHQVDDFDEFSNTHPLDCCLISCAYCNKSGRNIIWNLEHILPRKYYPELAFDLENILISCPDCNKKKGNKVGKSVGKLILPFQKRLAEKKRKKLLEIG